MSKLLGTFDQLFHDEALQGCIAVLHNFPLFLHQLVSRLIGKIQRQLRPLEGVDIADAVHKIRGGKHSHRVSRSVRDRLLRAVDAQILDIRNLGQCFRQRRPAQDLLHRIHQRIVGIRI